MKRPEISVKKMWDDFSGQTMQGISQDSTQYIVCKRIFFCGVAQSLFILRDVLGDPSVSEEQGIENIESISNEIDKFLNQECPDFKDTKYN